MEEEIGESAVHWLVGLVSLSLAFSASSFPSLASSLSLRLGSCILLTSRKISSARPPAPQTIPYLIFRVGRSRSPPLSLAAALLSRQFLFALSVKDSGNECSLGAHYPASELARPVLVLCLSHATSPLALLYTSRPNFRRQFKSGIASVSYETMSQEWYVHTCTRSAFLSESSVHVHY